MTRDQIIQWAREASTTGTHLLATYPELERFAALVAEHKREECAKLADSMNTFGESPDIGAAIRESK